MKKRVRTSPIWTTHTDEEFINLFHSCETLTELLTQFGLEFKGGNGKTLRSRCEALGLDYDKKAYNGRHVVGVSKWSLPYEQLFCENSQAPRHSVKRVILRDKLLLNKCAICGIPPEWNGRPLTLILDHINGVSNDNRLENLRLVCGNCNSQLDSHAGKQKRIRA